MLRLSGCRRGAGFLPHLVRHALPVLLLCGIGAPALAQNVSLTGGTYTQNFDTLSNTAGSTTNTALPTGWQLNETGGGARDNEQYAVDTGASTTGDTYSYGAAGSVERAFGGLRSGTLVPNIGACFTNNTGTTLSSLDIAYTGEQWRLGTAARTDSLNFQYSLDAISVTTGTWVDVAALNFVTPDTATTGAKNGNAAADRTAISGSITGLAIANGASFCIRWVDIDASGADDGLAVDDFSLTTTGSATPALAVNDVSAAEGNSGTTAFTFGFGLSQPAGAGGVTIQYATADGTAVAGSDYVATSGTVVIPQGSTSATVTVNVIGDTTTEPDETFFLNIVSATGANVSDGQGLGTILNDDVNVVAIHDIQGNGLASPLNGGVVVTEGIVTALKFNNGFFLQAPDAEADADPNTSEGIFVFTSTAPPAAAAVGNRVRVTATVSEFTPTTNLNQLAITELVSPTVVQLSTGNPLPAPIVLTTADFGPGATPGTAEKFEGMRVTVAAGRVVAPTDGNITESSATSSTTGVFNIVLDGVARPFREPGIDVLDQFPIPAGKNPPRFDHNAERIMVRSRGQVGATSLTPEVDAQIANMTGVMDYFSGVWALLPDVGSGTVTGGKTPTPVSDARREDVTVAGFNLQRFFDEVNDSNGATTLTAAAVDKRLTKASLAICNYLKTPDILGLVEVENLRVIGLLADRINSTCPSAPIYVPYLVQGNDVGGINVAYLVNTKAVGTTERVEVLEVTQYGKNTVFTNPNNSTSLLNDRPPLLLRALVHQDNGASYPITVIINHLRSLNGLDDTTPGSNGWATEGDRVRNKRGQQAVFLANLVHSLQTANPAEHIVLLGDFNAYQFSDGYVDVMGIVRGDEVPEDQVITWLPSPITTPLIDGAEFTLDPAERYSYTFDGSAQTLDHALLNEALVLDAADIKVEHARIDADFSVLNYGIAGTPTRISDHDPVRVAITVAAFRSADLSVVTSVTPAFPRLDQTVRFSARVLNLGPSVADASSVALVFNALVTPAITAPSGWTCAAPVQAGGNTTVTCTTPSLDTNFAMVFTADIVVDPSLANRTLTMDASTASVTTDPANGNNQSSVSVDTFANANLGIQATATAATINAGDDANFTVNVFNTGTDRAVFASTAFVFDALVSPVVTAPADWTCAAPVQDATTTTVTCTTPSFVAGAEFAIQVPTGGSVQSERTLNLAAAITSQIPDDVPGNNTSNASVTIKVYADLSVTLSPGPGAVYPGQNVHFDALVSQNGHVTIGGAVATFGFDAVVSPSITAPAGWTCAAPVQTASATSVTCNSAGFAAGAADQFGLDFVPDASLTGRPVVVTASISAPVTDFSLNNNQATAVVSVTEFPADLGASVTAVTPAVVVGQTVTFTANVTNAGPGSSSSPLAIFSFDALVSPVFTAPADWFCDVPSQNGVSTSVVCYGNVLAAEQSAAFSVSFEATPSLAGTTVSLTLDTNASSTDQNSENNSATAQASIDGNADLSATVAAAIANVPVGGTASYTASIANAGPASAGAVTLTLGFDAPVSPITTAPAGWTCGSPTQTAGATSVVCTTASLAAGANAAFATSFPATAALAGRTVRMTATVASGAPDPATGNNSASATVSIAAATLNADLSVRMIGRSERAGVFMLAVHNAGPASAAAPVVTVTGNLLPRNVSIVPASGWTCTSAAVGTGFRFVCTASGPMAAGADAYFGLALAGRGPQTVTVTANVASTTPDPNTANNTAVRTLVGAGLPDMCRHRYCRR